MELWGEINVLTDSSAKQDPIGGTAARMFVAGASDNISPASLRRRLSIECSEDEKLSLRGNTNAGVENQEACRVSAADVSYLLLYTNT